MEKDFGDGRATGPSDLSPASGSSRSSIPIAMGHHEAIEALCRCASTVSALSYQEAIEGYLKLRGMQP